MRTEPTIAAKPVPVETTSPAAKHWEPSPLSFSHRVSPSSLQVSSKFWIYAALMLPGFPSNEARPYHWFPLATYYFIGHLCWKYIPPCEGGGALAQAAQSSFGCPIPVGVQGQAGLGKTWDSGRCGMKWCLNSLPAQIIYDSVIFAHRFAAPISSPEACLNTALTNLNPCMPTCYGRQKWCCIFWAWLKICPSMLQEMHLGSY